MKYGFFIDRKKTFYPYEMTTRLTTTRSFTDFIGEKIEVKSKQSCFRFKGKILQKQFP